MLSEAKHPRPRGTDSSALGLGAVMLSSAKHPRPRRTDSSPAAQNDRSCSIVDVGHRRPMHLSVNIPDQELGPIATHELWAEIYYQKELKWSRVMAKCCVVDGAFYTPARRRQTPAPDVHPAP